MAEYTIKDVIIDPDDPRVEVGKQYYYSDAPARVVSLANHSERVYFGILSKIEQGKDYPFRFDRGSYACIIRKKEPRYVPFDLSKEEDRTKLRGAWVRMKGEALEYQVIAVSAAFVSIEGNMFNTKAMLDDYEFLDGTPCGKLAEEVENE